MINEQFQPLSTEKEAELMTAYHDRKDMSAREALVASCTPLVTQYVGAFAKRDPSRLEALTKVGVQAIEEAVDCLASKKDYRLGSLAPYYVKARLLSAEIEHRSRHRHA